MSEYQEIIDRLPKQMLAGEDNRLEILHQVLDALGHPEHQYQIIHVAGTNGKGSTGSLVARFLITSGYKVGHFNSPAMISDREQVLVNGNLISKDDFVTTFKKILCALPDYMTEQDLTIFEWWTVVMLKYFADQAVDWAVIECGLGGQDDATNVIDAPALAVITHLALDHTQILGSKIEDIAKAKAGIIKYQTRALVVAPNQPEAAKEILAQRAQEADVLLVEAASRVQVKLADGTAKVKMGEEQFTCPCNLHGHYQTENLTTALAIVKQLRQGGVTIDQTMLEKVLQRVTFPGRMEAIDHDPLVILDGAHNPDAAKQMVATIQEDFADRPVTMVLGFLADKDVERMVTMYQQVADHLIFTTPDNHGRAMDSWPLATAMGHEWAPDAREALELARELTPTNGVIIVTGSFYLIKELEEGLNDESLDR